MCLGVVVLLVDFWDFTVQGIERVPGDPLTLRGVGRDFNPSRGWGRDYMRENQSVSRFCLSWGVVDGSGPRVVGDSCVFGVLVTTPSPL